MSDHAEFVSESSHDTRALEALWTPDKEDADEGPRRPGGRLWTPGRR